MCKLCWEPKYLVNIFKNEIFVHQKWQIEAVQFPQNTPLWIYLMRADGPIVLFYNVVPSLAPDSGTIIIAQGGFFPQK